MKTIIRAICLLLALQGAAWGATYYMRADGTAANKAAATGCGSASTAMSVARHNDDETFSAGDTIYLCGDGGVFTATITPPSSGSSGSPITYIGTNSAEVNALRTLTPWTGPDGNGVYYATLPDGNIDMVVEDNVPLGTMASTSACANGSWFYDAGEYLKVYYKPTSGTPASHTVGCLQVAAVLRGSMTISNKNYITVSNITFSSNEVGVYGSHTSADSTGVIISGCTFNYVAGPVYFSTGSGRTMTGLTVTGNTIYRSRAGIKAYAADATALNTGGSFTNNTLTDNGSVTYWGGLTTDREAFGFQNLQDSTISGNTISGGYQIGLYLYGVGGATQSGNKFQGNKLTNTTGKAVIFLGDSTYQYASNIVAYNLIIGAGSEVGDALTFHLGNNGSSTQNQIANNAIINCGDTGGGYIFYFQEASANEYYTIKNNLVYEPGYRCAYHPTDATIIFDYNFYYHSGGLSNKFVTEADSFRTWAQWQADGHDTHGSDSNPLLNSSYGLQNNSPAKDQGIAITGIHSGSSITRGDAAGNTWLFGEGIDPGCFEMWQGHFQHMFGFTQPIPKIYTIP